MPRVDRIANHWCRKKKECVVVIETPKGRRNKLEYDTRTRLFKLGFILPKGMAFPYDFGFVPSTLAPDGDPLDVLVLMEEPADVGCVVETRIIGVIEAEQREGRKRFTNDRLLAVSVHSFQHDGIRHISDLDKKMLGQLEEFFISYNKARGRGFRVTDIAGPRRAAEIIAKGMTLYRKVTGKKAK